MVVSFVGHGVLQFVCFRMVIGFMHFSWR